MADESASRKRRSGIDSWLQTNGKKLQVGGELRIRLRKGPAMEITADPVDSSAPHESFPAILKFPVSTVQPNFNQPPWNTSRLYQQDVPKPEEDEDEEEIPAEKKRRWKYNRNAPVPRQWILQEEVDFLETMVDRRESKDELKQKKASSRYEGTPEHNPSHFLLFRMDHNNAQIAVRHMPSPESTILFQQPAVRKTMSLSEAEQAIQDQRNGILRKPTVAGPVLPRRQTAPNTTKNRLLQKLKQQNNDNDVEEGDDVMADVKFEKRKGSGTARRELLTSMAAGMSVSDDGVLGGTNDAAFAGRQRFAKLEGTTTNNTSGGGGSGASERGADGAAMADDFYTRDVSAEYEELDYDANEQFDDDDVDVGAEEITIEVEVAGDEEEEDDEDDTAEDEEQSVGGAAGLASAAGFQALLAKARGEAPVEAVPADDAKNPSSPRNKIKLMSKQSTTDHKSKLLAATQKKAEVSPHAAIQPTAQAPAPVQVTAPAPAAPELQVDENGLRILTLESVRQEIWLNQGQMPMKRLMKVFKVKGNAERQEGFRSIVKELCTVVKDHPVHGNMFVLKQHYRY